MNISNYGISFIKSVEGCRLTAYRDCVGVWTIGVGHTGSVDGHAVCSGMTITQDKASKLLYSDVRKCVNTINSKCTYKGLTQNMFDALCSFAFNVGTGALAKSTLLKKLNSGDISGAAAQFDCWNKPAQIIGRRNKEKALFLSGSNASSTNTSTVQKSSSFNQHLHDLQWAINKDEIAKLTEDGLWGNNSKSACKKINISVGSSKFNTIAWIQCRVGVIPDGKFGNGTKSQVIIWQKNHNLTPDGVVGYNTITSILREYGVNC